MRWPVSFMLYSDPTRIYTEPVQASQVGLTHFRSVVLYKRGIFDTKPPNKWPTELCNYECATHGSTQRGCSGGHS